MTSTASLQLLRLVSPALPVGAFSYSRGLEYAVFQGSVHDAASTAAWIIGVMNHSTAMLDAPVFVRMHRGLRAKDVSEAQRWSAVLLACRETQELFDEDQQMAAALARLLRDMDIAAAEPWIRDPNRTYAATFALASTHHGIDEAEATAGFLWSQAEGQVSAAVRLIPLGQTDGQRVLTKIIDALPEVIDRALSLPDHALGSVAPGLAMASAHHETQYTRLFRS